MFCGKIIPKEFAYLDLCITSGVKIHPTEPAAIVIKIRLASFVWFCYNRKYDQISAYAPIKTQTIFVQNIKSAFNVCCIIRRITRRRPGSLGFNIIWALTQETLPLLLANIKAADQHAHPHSLISTFVIHYLMSKITRSDIFNSPFVLVGFNMIKPLATPLHIIFKCTLDWTFSLKQTIWIQITLLPREQCDLDPYCLQYRIRLPKNISR